MTTTLGGLSRRSLVCTAVVLSGCSADSSADPAPDCQPPVTELRSAELGVVGCTFGRYLGPGEESDPAGDYVAVTVTWADVGDDAGLSLGSSAETVAGAFVKASSAMVGIVAPVADDAACSAVPGGATALAADLDAASGSCSVVQNVPVEEADVTYEVVITSADGEVVAAADVVVTR